MILFIISCLLQNKMISWYSIILLVVCTLLTILVIRLSEISTRMYTLEKATESCVRTLSTTVAHMAEHVTHRELHAVLDYYLPPPFAVGIRS